MWIEACPNCRYNLHTCCHQTFSFDPPLKTAYNHWQLNFTSNTVGLKTPLYIVSSLFYSCWPYWAINKRQQLVLLANVAFGLIIHSLRDFFSSINQQDSKLSLHSNLFVEFKSLTLLFQHRSHFKQLQTNWWQWF